MWGELLSSPFLKSSEGLPFPLSHVTNAVHMLQSTQRRTTGLHCLQSSILALQIVKLNSFLCENVNEEQNQGYVSKVLSIYIIIVHWNGSQQLLRTNKTTLIAFNVTQRLSCNRPRPCLALTYIFSADHIVARILGYMCLDYTPDLTLRQQRFRNDEDYVVHRLLLDILAAFRVVQNHFLPAQ